MIKKINIKIVLLVVILLSISLLYFSLYKDFIAPPSDDWSKEVILSSYPMDNEGLEYYKHKSFASTIEENLIFTATIDNTLNLSIHSYDLKGHLKTSNSLSGFVESKPDNMTLWSDENFFYLFIQSGNQIKLLTFDNAFTKVIDTYQIEEKFDSYKQHDEHLLLLQDDEHQSTNIIYHNLISKETNLSKTSYLSLADFIVKDDQLIIYGIDTEKRRFDFTQRIMSLSDTPENLEPQTLNDTPLLIMEGTIPLDVISYIDEPDGEIQVMFLLYSSRFADTYNYLKTYDFDSLSETHSRKFNTSNKYPNMSFLSLNLNKIDLITNTMTFVNKSEVGSRSEKYSNLILYTMGKDEKDTSFKPLTKTKSSNPFYEYYSSSASQEYNYLIFNSFIDGKEELYFASNDADIIALSKKIDFNDAVGILLGLLITLPPLCIMIFLQVLITCVPLAIIFIPVVFIAYDWTERNPEKITLAVIIAYLIAKLYYVYAHLNVQSIYKILQGYVPFYLKSPILIGIIIAVELVISYICMTSYRQKYPKSSFIKPVMIFVLTDLILFSLLFTVYTII